MLTRAKFREAVKRAGGLEKIKEAVGAGTIQAVSNWGVRGVPASKCKVFSDLTGVPLQELRDDWRDYWPDSVHEDSV